MGKSKDNASSVAPSGVSSNLPSETAEHLGGSEGGDAVGSEAAEAVRETSSDLADPANRVEDIAHTVSVPESSPPTHETPSDEVTHSNEEGISLFPLYEDPDFEGVSRVIQSMTRPIHAALNAAQSVIFLFDQERGIEWLGEKALLRSDDLAAYVSGLKCAADFFRAEPEAPLPAVWVHLHLKGLHDAGINSWGNLPFEVRLGWRVFRDTLRAIDEALLEEAKAAASSDGRALYRVPADETTVERFGDALELTEAGKRLPAE